jgi:hypothetical protein
VELRQYEFSPLVKVQGWSQLGRGVNLFETLVVFDNYPVSESLKQSGQKVSLENAGFTEQNNYPLTLTAAMGPELLLRIGYEGRRFEKTSIIRLLDEMRILLNGMVARPGAQVADIERMIFEAELKNQILEQHMHAELSRNKFMTIKPKGVRLASVESN